MRFLKEDKNYIDNGELYGQCILGYQITVCKFTRSWTDQLKTIQKYIDEELTGYLPD